ncbi:ATP-binding protein [Spongiactinospora sp. TRM90649]|uniref:ATP-binding protein n=1 Tax=Spongiactinospora sp. TRM90649 TaxID=3031114 RepID=UPI0023F6C3D0|nr:ATP-binding protein [Spongiactinospora sp. TRM90649]MDF5758813.1 ATP-binding protein [Spongiactinospora sp. TRM90649]
MTASMPLRAAPDEVLFRTGFLTGILYGDAVPDRRAAIIKAAEQAGLDREATPVDLRAVLGLNSQDTHEDLRALLARITAVVGTDPRPDRIMTKEAHYAVPHDDRAVGEARRFTTRILTAWEVHDEAIYDVTLLVSELVTNAVRYGKAPITLTLHYIGNLVRVEVTDNHPHFPSPNVGPPDVDEEHGRGLHLVAKLADTWGFDPAPSGKTAWCTKRTVS